MSEQLGSSKNWARELVDYYAEGYSDAEVAAAMNLPMREFYTLLKDNPTFAKIVEHGRTMSLAFWEGLARKNVSNKSFNTALYNFYMKNKHGWADKIETNNTNENNNLSHDQLKAEVYKKIQKLAEANKVDFVAAQEVVKPVEVRNDD